MKRTLLFFSAAALLGLGLNAQVCDPSTAPTGLTATYLPGSGALLEWDAVPGSVGVLLKVELPSGTSINRRIVGPEQDQFGVPDAVLTAGTYTWRVQAACSTLRPFDFTPISASSTFTVGSASTCPATVTDIDGNVYSTVEIGSQCWTAENLKVERYRNGDNIPTGLSDADWGVATSGAFAVYNDDAANKAIYGLLYNSFTTVDPRGLCPTGWHVPTDEEWTELIDFLGGEGVAGGAMKATGTSLWLAPNADATNTSGLSMLPGGIRFNIGGFQNQGSFGYYWSSSGLTPDGAWYRMLFNDYGTVDRSDSNDQDGLSVRCLRD
jgi:uncharacterized protein (TIGR02145 family)